MCFKCLPPLKKWKSANKGGKTNEHHHLKRSGSAHPRGKNKLQDAREVISHLFDLMYDYEQEYAISNIGEEYSMSQVRDTSNLLAALIGSDKMRLENK